MKTSASIRRRLDPATVELIERSFPGQTFDQAVATLAAHCGRSLSDPVSCAQTELWIKLDRLEEMIGLISLTNIDLADLYRRMVSRDLGLFRAAAVKLTQVAADHQKETKP